MSPEAVPQFRAGPQKPALRRGNRNPQLSRYFRHRPLLHLSHEKNMPQQGRNASNFVFQNFADLSPAQLSFGIRRTVFEIERHDLIAHQCIVNVLKSSALCLAQAHQALIDYDTRQPRTEFRVMLELLDVFVCFPECVLYFVFGVLIVSYNGKRQFHGGRVMPFHQCRESRIVAALAQPDKLVIQK
jgi:hypothetical protein